MDKISLCANVGKTNQLEFFFCCEFLSDFLSHLFSNFSSKISAATFEVHLFSQRYVKVIRCEHMHLFLRFCSFFQVFPRCDHLLTQKIHWRVPKIETFLNFSNQEVPKGWNVKKASHISNCHLLEKQIWNVLKS